MDIEIIFKIAGIGIVIAVVVQILKKADRDDIATIVTIVGVVIVLVMAIDMISELFDSMRRLFLYNGKLM